MVRKRTHEHREILNSEFLRDRKSNDACADDDRNEMVHRTRSVVVIDL